MDLSSCRRCLEDDFSAQVGLIPHPNLYTETTKCSLNSFVVVRWIFRVVNNDSQDRFNVLDAKPFKYVLQIPPTRSIGPTNSNLTSTWRVFDGDLGDANILKNIFKVNLACKVPKSSLSENLTCGQNTMEVEVELLF